MKSSIAFRSCLLPLQPMRSLFILSLCCALVMIGCRKRKLEPTAPIETAKQPEAAQVSAPSAPAQSKQAAPLNIPSIEAGVEFGDLNNMIEGFEQAHKRMPTVEDLKKSYYGGTKPLPIPPGYKLVIDQKSKKARLVTGN